MSDALPQPVPEAPSVPPRPPRRRAVWRWSRRFSGVVLAVVAATFISTFSIDLGPVLKGIAEKQATNFMHRPMHIGKLSAKLRLGEFQLDNIMIEGLKPTDRPFLRAQRLTLYVPWWSIFTEKLIVEDVHMTGWSMTIEQFADGKTSLPKLTPEKKPGAKPLPFTTTVRIVHTDNGEFTYDDHGSPWSVVCPHLNVSVANLSGEYHGTAVFWGGTVQIAKFQPMRADFNAAFKVTGPLVELNRIHMVTDGAVTDLSGKVDFAHFPEMTFNIAQSRIHFPTMRQLFFHDASYEFEGDGTFTGIFHVFQGGRDLSGTFLCDQLGVEFQSWGTYRFQHLTGSLTWTRNYFKVHEARSDFYGGRINQVYSLMPLGTPKPATARWQADYDGVDLQTFGDALHWPVLRLSGHFSGHNVLEWPNGSFHERRGDGEIFGTPLEGVSLASLDLPPLAPAATAVRVAAATPAPVPPAPVKNPEPIPPLGPLPTGGHVTYHWFPDWIDVDDSWVASPHTYVQLHGRTAYFGDSTMPFHLTSTDWQESDRVLVAIMGAFRSQASAIEVGGQGTVDGTLTRTFTNPHIAGTFVGRLMRAWNVTWGPIHGDVVIDNSYADITGGVIGEGASTMTASGRYSLGFPRKDQGEELDARVHMTHWPVLDLRTAFQMVDWPLDGFVTSDLHLYGKYKYPDGFGNMRIEDGIAWGEKFTQADAGLRFDPESIHVDGLTIEKGATGVVTGAAILNWAGTYSFEAEGQKIPVESLTRLSWPKAKLTGLLQFSATGAGEFLSPRYKVHGAVADLFTGDEGIGALTGDITLDNQTLAISVNAASARMAASGGGTLRLAPNYEADLTFRFTDTSIDPYLRMLAPGKFEFVKALANGSIHVVGDPTDWTHLAVDAIVNDAHLTLFDFPLDNDGSLKMSFRDSTFTVNPGEFRFTGAHTALELSGAIASDGTAARITTTGNVDLGVLKAFFPNLNSSGEAKINATIEGDISEPAFSGQGTITEGRVRYLGYEQLQGLDHVNGTLLFNRNGIELQDLHATLGEGDIRFEGRIPFKGLFPSEFELSAHGENMHLRYPKDFLSTVSADLQLTGPVTAPQLTGDVTVERTTYTRQFEGVAGLVSFFTSDADATSAPSAGGEPTESAFPLTIDVRLRVPPISFIDNNDLRLAGHADLRVQGTPAHLSVLGNLDIDSGKIAILGNTFQVTHGSLNFNDPTRVQPLIDVEVETNVRVPGQNYLIVGRVTGTTDHWIPTCTSDPPLPSIDCLSLLLGQPADLSRAELRALGAPQQGELNLMQSVFGQVAGAAVLQKSGVGNVVQRLSGVDTVQITPQFSNELAFQNLTATARVSFGKRISDRVYLTYSRAINASQSEVVLLEYDQNDRIQWVISRNEDRTYAIDFRIRYRF